MSNDMDKATVRETPVGAPAPEVTTVASSAEPPSAPAPEPAPRPKKGVPEAANYRLLQAACETYLDQEGRDKVDRAYRFAADYHRDQRRRSGEPYINHPVEVALILAHDLRMDEDTICAALLHDTVRTPRQPRTRSPSSSGRPWLTSWTA